MFGRDSNNSYNDKTCASAPIRRKSHNTETTRRRRVVGGDVEGEMSSSTQHRATSNSSAHLCLGCTTYVQL